MKIKTELVELFGAKPEDAYERARKRVLTGKPSQLGKALISDLCKKGKKLDGCCCAPIVWGMFRDQLPIAVRNHIAEKPFNKDTYKEIFKTADQVFDSNSGSEPLPQQQVAAVAAAVQKSQKGQNSQKNKNQNNKNSQKPEGQSSNKNQNQSAQGQTPSKKKKLLNQESLCRIHAKWKENATFCAAPWGCRMKNVYKEPQ